MRCRIGDSLDLVKLAMASTGATESEHHGSRLARVGVYRSLMVTWTEEDSRLIVLFVNGRLANAGELASEKDHPGSSVLERSR